MNELFAHIEFLLHTHDCVIVPNFGGFVLNRTSALRDGLSVFNAPHWELIFNRSLTYNDGLLVESFMKTNEISFEAACKKIELAVEDFKQKIRKNSTLKINHIGTFILGSGGIISLQPQKFVRPEFFGLEKVSLMPMIQLQHQKQSRPKATETQSIENRTIGTSIASVVAIIALFFLISPIRKNLKTEEKTQTVTQSSFIPTTPSPNINPIEKTATSSILRIKEITPQATGSTVETSIKQNTDVIEEALSRKKYEIIMGVYNLEDDAQRLIQKLQKEGFSNIYTFLKYGRINVSVGGYVSKTVAVDKLQKIRQTFPHHKDAWLLKK